MEYLRTGHKFVKTYPLASKYGVGFSFTSLFLLTSIFIPSPFRYIVWILAMLVDLIITEVVTRKYIHLSPNTFIYPKDLVYLL